ncbi:cordon-bleu protein-like 1 isoform X3 [Crotalus tigris]|uniref:cordon-bleu protein-like 1 isoform X3 n=1 Tax=Crotalus tigris TaxID=88082 RepID=UPI00192F2C0B|nr:cordon-bleu protein-like 1 isoform X3 [Crotalus tigris]
MDGQTCSASSDVALSRRKAKSKAPLPPPETKVTDCSSFDDLELTNCTMDQKENAIDRDIQLSVLLPGEVIKTTNVNGSKPMMDLLVYLCAQYHLNPASHIIDLMSAEKKPIKFKPNTPIGMLEFEQVILKPKQMDKKKPIPIIPEQTVRVVVNYKKTQKTVVRVSPHAPLQEIVHIISSKCDFDPLHTVLLKTYQSRETLDLTKSLNDLGLRELYAMDVSRATPTTEHSLSSLQDSFQNTQNSENLKEKGFFGIFQRSKKKRQQTTSAPATPLINKPRPAFSVRSSSVSKQYDSNTLPSEMPKKRRAPLPPMPASQSVPQDLAQSQDKPKICMLKSSSVDETDKGLSGMGMERSGSLHLSGTSSVNSSLRRTKRKAPSPPSRKLHGQSDHSIDTGSESAESIHTESIDTGKYSKAQSLTGNVVDLTRTPVAAGTSCSFDPTSHDQNNVQQVADESRVLVNTDTPDESEVSLKSDMGSEYSLKEIDEKEETHDNSLSASEVPLDVQKHETASDPSFDIGDNAQESNEEKTENTSARDKAQDSEILSEGVSIPNGTAHGTLQPNTNNGHKEATYPLPSNKLSKEEIGKSNKPETVDDTSLNGEMSLNVHDQKCDPINVDVIKTQDVAIQTISEDNCGQTALSENGNHQSRTLSPHKNSTHVHKPVQKNHSSGALNMMSKPIGQADQSSVNPNGTHDNALVNENQVLPETIVRSPISSPTKTYPLYRQDSKPKPKPSNEITRDYIPKVGMTTYKIVPPKFLETAKNRELDPVEPQEATVSPKNENSQEFGTQTETANISKRLYQTEPDFKNEFTLYEVKRDSPPKTYPAADHSPVSFSSAQGQKMEVEHPRPNQDYPIPPLILNSGKKSSPPAVQEKPKILSPPIRPSNFYLQIQRRTTDHYVTSAIARSGSLSSPIQSEAKTMEVEKKVASPDQPGLPLPKPIIVPSQLPEETTEKGCNEEERKATTSLIQSEAKTMETEKKVASPDQPGLPLPKPITVPSRLPEETTENGYNEEERKVTTFPIQNEAKTRETEKKVASPDQPGFPLPKPVTVPSQLPEKTTENGCNEEERKVTSPIKVSQPLISPSSQPSPLQLKTLRTFILPQPYSSPKPSPFALAVSSAVKRSQSFSKTCANATRPLKEQSSLDLSSSASNIEVKDYSSIPSPTTQTQQILTDKQKTNDASYEQNRQAPPLFNHPATAICERSLAAAVQHPDPEQIHQSLLAAIRSGEAAAKLRRVAPPSNTIAINGRSSLSSPVSIETRYGSH